MTTTSSIVLVSLGMAGCSAGCSANYQAVYEGEVRFEHCYRLDIETGVELSQRRACWKDWTSFHTYGQTRDRLEYALRRQRELTKQMENPEPAASDTPIPAQPPAQPTSAPVAVPAPSTPFAPPLHVQDKSIASGSSDETNVPPTLPTASPLASPLTSGQQPTAQPCLLQCHARWQPCVKKCGAKPSSECERKCDASFQGCGRLCFEK